MQFSAIRQYAALRFRDASNVVVSDANWITYVNDAYQDMLARCTWFPWNEASSTVTVNAGTRSTALPADVWQILSVWDSVNFMPLVPLEGRGQVYQIYPTQTEIGVPQHYRMFGRVLQVFPLPQSNVPYTVEYVLRPSDMVADADLPVFPPQYHSCLVSKAVALAYRDDGNLQMAGAYESEYEDSVKMMFVDMMQPRNERYYEVTDDLY